MPKSKAKPVVHDSPESSLRWRGFPPPQDGLELDGQLRVYPIEAKGARHATFAWYVGHPVPEDDEQCRCIFYGELAGDQVHTWAKRKVVVDQKLYRDALNQLSAALKAIDRTRHLTIQTSLNIYVAAAQQHPWLRKHWVAPFDARQAGESLAIGIRKYTVLGMMWEGIYHIAVDGQTSVSHGDVAPGSFILLGGIEHMSRIYVVEDYASACTLYQLTQGQPVFCTMRRANMMAVAKAVRKYNPANPISIVAINDSDIGGESIRVANKVAADVGAYVTTPEEAGSYNDDVCRRANRLESATPANSVVVPINANP
jgi:hypothetical protein